MSEPDLLDVVVDVVAHNEPVVPEDLPAHLEDRGVDVTLDNDRAAELLATVEAQSRVMSADGKYWVIRKGRYSYDEFFRQRE